MGALAGVKVLEFEAIGPAPFCGMMLSDMGADVLLAERASDPRQGFGRERWFDVMLRGRRSVTLDLKSEGGMEAALALAEKADVLIEGYRPGVMERLGLGPDVVLRHNPKLVYSRITGWGQHGPFANLAGHDINYLALSGVLNAIGRKGERPVTPLNLVGDFGGGGMLLAFGLVCALLEARRTGRGQVIDGAMTDGAALLATMFSGMLAANRWSPERGSNVLDSGAPWYDTYQTRDGKFVAVGAIEPRFYHALLAKLGLENEALPEQRDQRRWPELRERFAAVFRTRTRDEWAEIFKDSDACVTPVLSFVEAPRHPHHQARDTYLTSGRIEQPAPAPRLSMTPASVRSAPPERGEDGEAALLDWGFGKEDIRRMQELGLGYMQKP